MKDDDFLGYCELHCRTERALFSSEQIKRLCELANQNPPENIDYHEWVSARANYVQFMVDIARRRIREAEERDLHENVLARGFVEGEP